MKKITLLVASIFLAGGMAYASENPVFSDNQKMAKTAYCNDEPIRFNERGIEFYVFPNGDFDFNTRPDATTDGDYYFKGAGKRNTAIDERGLANYGVRIERDYFGRIRRVGNTFINYDAFDRVNRIGTVFMRYNRFALSQIGGLRIIYDRRGNIIDMIGSVKGRYGYYNDYHNPRGGGYYSPNNSPYDNGGYSNGNDDYNDDNYYFKKENSKDKIEDSAKEKKEDNSGK